MRAALASKVSRERIGTELEGMFHGVLRHIRAHACVCMCVCEPVRPARGRPAPPCHTGAAPTAAVRLLHQLQLFSEVFALPPVLRGAHAGGDYGSPCVELMAIAERLVSELDLQVWGL